MHAAEASGESHPEAAQPTLAGYGPEGAAQLRGVEAADDVAGQRQVLQRDLRVGAQGLSIAAGSGRSTADPATSQT